MKKYSCKNRSAGSRKRRTRKMKMKIMKGCYKKHSGGGGGASNMQLAYTGQPIQTVRNPALAYTGKGGMRTTPSMNLFPNSQNGGCGCGGTGLQAGGSSSGTYPNGLVGSSWTPKISGWPGVDGINGNRNYLAHNDYKVDPQTQGIISERSTYVTKGGRRHKNRTSKKGRRGRGRGRRGGGFLPDDLVNLGRQVSYGVGSAYNTLAGYPQPVNPLPYKDQLVNVKDNQLLNV